MTRAFVQVLLCCLSLLLAPIAGAEVDQAESQRQLDTLKRNIQALDNWLAKANTEKSGLVRALRRADKDISEISLQIRELTVKNKALQSKLGELETQKNAQRQALDQQKTQLIAQLRALYLQGNQPALKLLLDQDDPQDLSRYMRYFSYINDARGEKIESFKQALNALQATQQDILRQQTQLAKNRSQLQENRIKIGEQKKQRQQVLAKLESKISSKADELDKLKADQKRLEELLLEVEQAIANLALPSDATPFSKQKSKLPWPARGKVVERFGSRIAQGKLRSRGIRIASKEDAPVTAVHYGRVVFSDWLRGFGLLLIIDHGDGYMSLYGSNKSLLKDTGDWVSAGELIAYSGHSGDSQEVGLYFEIRRHGTPLNPISWLRK